MMQKQKTAARVRFAYAAVLPVLAATMFVCNPVRARIMPTSTDNTQVIETSVSEPLIGETTVAQIPPTGDSVPFANVEDQPKFQGGDANDFAKWVAGNMEYPKEAFESGIQGRVMVQFKICTDGEVRDVKVLRGVHELLDAEAVRVISASPKWEPGLVDGQPVNVTYSFPIVFKLSGDEKPKEANQFEGVLSYSNMPGNVGISFTYKDGEGSPLVLLDGKKCDAKMLKEIDPSTIESMEILKDQATLEKYGEEAKYGVVLITSKKQ